MDTLTFEWNGRTVTAAYPMPKINLPAGVSAPESIEIQRIDFIQEGAFTTVNKLGMNEFGKTIVVSGKRTQGFDIDAALRWCRENNWAVRAWPGGARAWKYGLKPVRGEAEIKKLRDELRNSPRPELAGQGVNLDLRYDL